MCFSNLSSCDLIGLASSLAIAIGKELTSDELSILSSFFSALGDNFGILASKK